MPLGVIEDSGHCLPRVMFSLKSISKTVVLGSGLTLLRRMRSLSGGDSESARGGEPASAENPLCTPGRTWEPCSHSGIT